MNRKQGLILFVVLLALLISVSVVAAQGPVPTGARAPSTQAGTAFTYQGQLKNSGTPVNATCNFQFGLWDATSGGLLIAGTITQTVPNVSVSNGLFTTSINFGASAINGDARYLAMAVACPSGSGYTPMSTRQALTPAPMALALPGFYTQQTTTSPNIIGGASTNVVSSTLVGQTISGGGWPLGAPNIVWGSFGTVGGGVGNYVYADTGTISGGENNHVTASHGTVSGGFQNYALGRYASASGGYQNSASGFAATIPGGYYNSATMTYTLAAGNQAQALHPGAFVWADSTDAVFASTANNQFLVRANGGMGVNTNAPATTFEVAGLNDGADTMAVRGTMATNRRTGIKLRSTTGGTPTNEFEIGTDYMMNNTHDFFIWDAVNSAIRLSIDNAGEVAIPVLGSAGIDHLCRNASNQIASCSSSLRYKNNIANLNLGLDAIAKLRPVTFDWKDSGQADLGFVAEEVNQVTPLLTTLNNAGQIEGVKYDRVTAILVKGIQEQQQQIADLKTQNASLESRLATLEQAVQVNNAAHPDQTGNIAMIVVGALLGIVIVQKPWRRDER